MAYATAAIVRMLLTEITDDVDSVDPISDDDILAYSTDIVDPEINSRLGLTADIAPVPAVIKMIASRKVACEIVNARITEDDEPSAWAQAMCEKAESVFSLIVAAQADVTGVAVSLVVVSDPAADWQREQVFGNNTNPLDWHEPIIRRSL